jgi:hypothetical protein
MTKSSLPIRDLDTWRKVNEKSGFMYLISLVHSSDSVREIFEPGASPVEERLNTLKAYKEAGCYTGILALPLLPGINDTPENLHFLYQTASSIGVDFLMPGGLTLRPGRQKEYFMQILAKHRPDLITLYKDLYRENRPSGAPLAAYESALYKKCLSLNAQYHLPFLVPHYVYRNKIHRYDEISVLLRHMGELYQSKGIETRPLKQAVSRYMSWLKERKSLYNRKRSWSYYDLDGELITSIQNGTLPEIIKNEKLADFTSKMVTERQIFDYCNLKPYYYSQPGVERL